MGIPITEKPAPALNLDKLAKAVGWHETHDCTLGYGLPPYNNCTGLKRGSIVPCKTGKNRMCMFASKEESYEAFRRVWEQGYSSQFPTLRIAEIYSGHDKSRDWYNNVTTFYHSSSL